MGSKYRVVITDFIRDELGPELEILGDIAQVDALAATREEELAGKIEDADALLVFHDIAITRRTIDQLRHCRLITRCGVGYDNVDIRAARERGIPVANVPDYGTEEVADSAIGMMLALTRGFLRYDSRLRQQTRPWTYLLAAPLRRLRGRTLGIVGFGRIGKATALRAKALGMDVIFYDPYVEDGYDKALGVRRAESLAELCRQSLVVSLHCPLTDETRRIINAESLEWMPTGSFLVNTARGGLADTRSILESLLDGRLAGVALDVLPEEPPADDDPLILAWRDPQHAAYDRILINPHSAFYCEEGLREMRTRSAINCRRALLGEPLRNVVNGVVPTSTV